MVFLSLHKRETMGKTIKKIQIVLSIIILTLIGMSVLLFILTLLPPIQRWTCEKMTSEISSALGVDVKADRLRFFPFTTVGLFDLEVVDSRGELIVEAKCVKADFALSSLFDTKMSFSEVTLDGVFFFARKRSTGEFNFEDMTFESDTTGSSSLGIDVREVSLRNCAVMVVDDGSCKWNVVDIDSHIGDIVFTDSVKSVTLSYLSAFDELRRRNISLSMRGVVSADTVKIQGLDGYYGNTIVGVDSVCVVMQEGGEPKDIRAEVSKLRVDNHLLSEYLPTWQVYDVDVKGNYHVTPTQIEATQVEVLTTGRSMFKGDVYVDNYRQRDDMEVDVDIESCKVNMAELAMVVDSAMLGTSPLLSLGLIEVSGTIKGKSDNLVGKAYVVSNVGMMGVDGKVSITNDKIVAEGKMYSNGMDFSAMSDGNVGLMSFETDVTGYVDRDSLFFVQVDGTIDYLTFKGYRYDKVEFNGFTDNNRGNMLIDMNDKNGNLQIIGEYESDADRQAYVLTAKVDSFKTGKTNLTPDIPSGEMSFASRISLVTRSGEITRGNIYIGGFSFLGAMQALRVEKFMADVNHDGMRKGIVIESDNLNGVVEGDFAYEDIWPMIYNQSLLSVGKIGDPMPIKSDVEMKIDMQYDNVTPIMQFVLDSMSVGGKGRLEAEISSKRNMVNATLISNQLKYKDYEIADLEIDVASVDDVTNINAVSSLVSIPLLGVVYDVKMANEVSDNCMESVINWHKGDATKTKSNLKFSTCLSRDFYGYVVRMGLKPSSVVFEKEPWEVEESTVELSSHSLMVEHFRIASDEKYMAIDGMVDTKTLEDTMLVTVNKFVVEDIIKTNPQKDKFTIAGDLSVSAKITDFDDSYIIDCKAGIDRFFVNGDYLEHLDVETGWSSERNRLDLDLAIVTDDKCRAHGIGGYDIRNNDFSIYFDIDSLSIGFLNHYLNVPIEQISGTTSGDLVLSGAMPEVLLNARLILNESPFKVRQTAVDYLFTGGDSIILAPDDMEFRNLRFTDKHGNKGTFFGHIRHNMFSGLKLDLGFKTDDLLVLESTETENPTYYGRIFADGLLGITGTTSNVELTIDASTCPNTEFNILPLGKSDVEENTYIKFSSSATNMNNVVDYEAISSSVTARLNVHIEPTAKICVIVNPRTNNMISATGMGDLQLVINKSGDLNIFGDYVIEQGMYNFSFENLLNKQFIINQGGTLSWDGAPYNARIDLVAKYGTKASLYDLVAGSGDAVNSEMKRRVPVNVNINLTERLADPNIRFDIEIPSSLNFNQYTLDQYVNSDEEMNRQAISLLLTNKFSVVQEANSSGQNNTSDYVSTTLSELVSNQISSWISQNKYNVNLGINYRPGDEVTNEEYGVAMSTQILNNKIVLSGNIGYGRGIDETSEGSVIGDFDIEYKINKSGNLRAKAYTHSNNDVLYETSPTTQGIGISFSEEFNTFGELMRKYWAIITGKRKRQQETENK